MNALKRLIPALISVNKEILWSILLDRFVAKSQCLDENVSSIFISDLPAGDLKEALGESSLKEVHHSIDLDVLSKEQDTELHILDKDLRLVGR